MPDDSVLPLIPFASTPSISPASSFPIGNQRKMDDPRLVGGGGGGSRSKARLWILVLSYAFDWFILMVGAAIGYVMGEVTPNKRPFSLVNPEIGFPYTVKETVPVWLAIVIAVFGPIVIIAIICLVFVPGSTVPPGTPKSLIWKRKLWELHTAYLGLALSIVAAWLITNGLKNIYGKPRPDLLARCQPDLDNLQNYIIRPYKGAPNESSLVKPSICQNTDKHMLDDGFRSFPSGHSSSSAAGLIYLTLFIASKFAITIPFFASGGSTDASALTAFPSRNRVPSSKSTPEAYELQPRGLSDQSSMVVDPQKRLANHNKTVAAVRRQAAAPPLYLMLIAIIPLFTSVFIASTRWFDYRHHGFDILFGFLIGTVTAFFAFRYYHLPISRGAGWAWGPRSPDKAFWAGVGSYSYATDRVPNRAGDEEEALDSRVGGFGHGSGIPTVVTPSSRKGTATDDRPQETGYMGATAI